MSATYRVSFRKRFNQQGGDADSPVTFLDLPEGIVLDSTIVETLNPDNLHGEENMEEDDDWMSLGTEVWDFDIAKGAERQFKDALVNSGMVMEYERIDESDDDIPAKSGGTA